MKSIVARTVVRGSAVLFSLVGMVVSYHLASKHFALAVTSRPATASAPASAPASQPSSTGVLGLLDQACSSMLPNTGCEEVIQSEWGSVTVGGEKIPVALLGLNYFTCMFWWFLLIGYVTPSRGWVHVLVACVMAVGLGTSIFLVYQMSRLPVWCPLCAASHVANLLMFVCMLLLWPRSVQLRAVAETEVPAAQPPAPGESTSLFAPMATARAGVSTSASEAVWPHWWMLAVTPVVALLSIWVEVTQLQARHRTPSAEADQLRSKLKTAEAYKDYYEKAFKHYEDHWEHTYISWLICPPMTISTEGEPVRGPANAPHTMVIFSDFQCPTCGRFEETLENRIIPMAVRYGGVKVVFKQWPICTQCNPNASNNLHPSACDAALAAEAAFMLGGNTAFWKMHDALFKNQSEWKGPRNFDKYAREIGLDLDAFHKAMKSEEALARVRADIQEGANLANAHIQSGQVKESEKDFLAVNSTPSVYIDNRKLNTLHQVRAWQMILGNPVPVQGAPMPDLQTPAAPVPMTEGTVTRIPTTRPRRAPATRSYGPRIDSQ